MLPTQKLAWIFLVTVMSALAKAPEPPAGRTFTLASFDPNCGQPGKNCRPAFQQAFAAIAAAGGGTLLLPAGTFVLDFPEILSNTRNAPPLSADSLLLVPPRTIIRGHAAADGTPDTVVEWSVTSIPLFIFRGASYSGMQDLHFRFTGVTTANFPYGDVSLLRALGFRPTFPHTNQMSGGNYEMFSVVYLLDSEHCRFNNLTFDSETSDDRHVMGYGFNVKGKHIVVAGGAGGLTELAADNEFTNLKLYDYVMGLSISGQQDLRISNITADRRGSAIGIALGHVIYTTSQLLHNPGGSNTDYYSKNVEISNVFEGPHTHSNVASLGTFAIKYIDGGVLRHVVSHHPAGLIQTLFTVQNMKFEDLTWESDSRICEDPLPSCQVSVIYSTANVAPDPPLSNLIFEKIRLKSIYEPITVILMGDHVIVKDFTIETPPTFQKGQTNSFAALSVKNASDVTVSGYRYIPRLTEFDSREQHYNAPFTCWIPCHDVTVNEEIVWPDSLPLPPPHHRVVTPSWQDQDKDPEKHLAVATKISRGRGIPEANNEPPIVGNR
jgi:hypothetical protein